MMKKVTAALVVLASAAPAFAQDGLPPNHPPVAAQNAPGGFQTADELIRELDKTEAVRSREKPFEVALSLGRLYYGNGRFPDAVLFLGQALEMSEPLRKAYLGARAKAKGVLPAAPEACAGEAPIEKKLEHVKKAGGAAASAACALAALQPALEAERMLGQAKFLTGDTAGALATFERLLAMAPEDAEALSAHAHVLFESKPDDVKALAKAKAQWEQSLKLQPTSPKAAWTRRLIARAEQAIAAGGLTALEQKQATEARTKLASAGPASAPSPRDVAPPPLTRETMQAIQNTQVTPEMTERFGKLIEEGEEHLARGRFQAALDNYKQVMPFQPENARLRAGMAWALVGLKRQPMADRVWQVAVSSDPASVDALGKVLKAKGDATGARSVWAKLAETDPAYAQRAGLKQQLEK